MTGVHPNKGVLGWLSDPCRYVASQPGACWSWGPLQCDCGVPQRDSHSDWCVVWRRLAVWRTEQHEVPNIQGLSEGPLLITNGCRLKKVVCVILFPSQDFLSIRFLMHQRSWCWQRTSLTSDFSWWPWRTVKLSRLIWWPWRFPGLCPRQVRLPHICRAFSQNLCFVYVCLKDSPQWTNAQNSSQFAVIEYWMFLMENNHQTIIGNGLVQA